LSPKKNISVDLFNEALRNENNGQYEKAVANYESALNEVNKTRFHKTFKNKIIEKLKVLHTLIEYNNGVRMIRQ
jgi:tetratricopeptide (TPR) repeat protein